jgi:hypothetical protein
MGRGRPSHLPEASRPLRTQSTAHQGRTYRSFFPLFHLRLTTVLRRRKRSIPTPTTSQSSPVTRQSGRFGWNSLTILSRISRRREGGTSLWSIRMGRRRLFMSVSYTCSLSLFLSANLLLDRSLDNSRGKRLRATRLQRLPRSRLLARDPGCIQARLRHYRLSRRSNGDLGVSLPPLFLRVLLFSTTSPIEADLFLRSGTVVSAYSTPSTAIGSPSAKFVRDKLATDLANSPSTTAFDLAKRMKWSRAGAHSSLLHLLGSSNGRGCVFFSPRSSSRIRS